MDVLDSVIADRLEKLLKAEGLRREDVAREMRGLGFRWTANRVTQVVRGNRSMSVLELAGMCAVLRRPFGALVGDEGEIELPAATVEVADIWKAVMGISTWTARQPQIDTSVVGDETTLKAARGLGVAPGEVDAASERLWGHDLATERDRRVRHRPDEPPRAMQARRGHETRTLLAELRTYLDQEQPVHQTDADQGTHAAANQS